MKKMTHTLAALMALALLSACGGNAAQTPTEPAPPAPTLPPPTATPVPTNTNLPTSTSSPIAEPTPASSSNPVSFAAAITPIFEAKCVKCHGVERIKEGLNMLTYDGLIKGSFNGPVLVPGNADESLMVQLIVEGEMPNRGTKITPEELQIIKDWINQGALNN